MIRRALALLLVLPLVIVGQGEAQAAGGRVDIAKTGTHARIVRVPIRNGEIKIGSELTHTVYTWDHGDPPCDSSGSTAYFGHAWRAGPGVGDRWGSLRKGNLIKVAGCKFRVTRREFWSPRRSIVPLFRVDGPAQVVLFTCKADDYSKRTVVFARKVG